MNKTELIAAVAEQAELSKKDAEKAVKAFTDVVAEELVKGEKVQLVGFGNFEAFTTRRLCQSLFAGFVFPINHSTKSIGRLNTKNKTTLRATIMNRIISFFLALCRNLKLYFII